MKLLTQLTASRDGSLVDATDENLIHDAACAHALMLAMGDEIKRVSQIPYNSREICEYFMENVKKRADEIMAGWGFDSGEVE